MHSGNPPREHLKELGNQWNLLREKCLSFEGEVEVSLRRQLVEENCIIHLEMKPSSL
jgi:hypothetical protein